MDDFTIIIILLAVFYAVLTTLQTQKIKRMHKEYLKMDILYVATILHCPLDRKKEIYKKAKEIIAVPAKELEVEQKALTLAIKQYESTQVDD